MKIYDNGCYMWEKIVLGMARAMVSEAKTILQGENGDRYNEIIDKIDENAIDKNALILLVKTATAYCKAGLLKNTTNEGMQDEGVDLFFDLYFGNNHHLLRENDSANEFYEKYQRIFEKSLTIGESVDDDIRVFFE